MGNAISKIANEINKVNAKLKYSEYCTIVDNNIRCTICGNLLKTYNNFNGHMRNLHPNTVDSMIDIRYLLGKIYKLINFINARVYVGSTIQSLDQRFAVHKCKSKKYPDIKVYQHIAEIGWDNISIELLEKYPCANQKELNMRERYWCERLESDLNDEVPSRLMSEYQEEHKEEKKAYDHDRYIKKKQQNSQSQ